MLVVVLGSRTVEMLGTQSLIIHGPRVFRLAKVGYGNIVFLSTFLVRFVLFKMVALINVYAWHSDRVSPACHSRVLEALTKLIRVRIIKPIIHRGVDDSKYICDI